MPKIKQKTEAELLEEESRKLQEQAKEIKAKARAKAKAIKDADLLSSRQISVSKTHQFGIEQCLLKDAAELQREVHLLQGKVNRATEIALTNATDLGQEYVALVQEVLLLQWILDAKYKKLHERLSIFEDVDRETERHIKPIRLQIDAVMLSISSRLAPVFYENMNNE